ncbi:hypothetical protein KC571_02490 [candidate division WWE3 bacterium]|uniref:UDP-N-acetylglucosamine 1-carboxyvinyltransferase n=1 Tax=candidate division WWE3 bacterium TaxID=2053526 RepID=A0A955RPH7_UNCKA|nr:hypothetical protein [candidate division WWE3 bacterium]
MPNTYVITGGKPVKGEITIGGSTQLASYMLAASILASEPVKIKNLPQTTEIDSMLECLKFLGVAIHQEKSETVIDASTITTKAIPANFIDSTARNLLFWGAIFARFARASIGESNKRTGIITQLLGDLSSLFGEEITFSDGYATLQNPVRLSDFRLADNSELISAVVVLLSILGNQSITLHGISEDPEITRLLDILIEMGANIELSDNQTVQITGVAKLKGTTVSLDPDKDELAFWVMLVLGTTGDVVFQETNTKVVVPLTSKLTRMGVKYKIEGTSLHVWLSDKKGLNPLDIHSREYPGFDTVWACWLTVVLTQIDGVSEIRFSKKPMYVEKLLEGLKKFGAEVNLHSSEEDTVLEIFGPTKLKAFDEIFNISEAAISMLLAASISDGVVTLTCEQDLSAIFEDFFEKLQTIGISIKSL